jgi:hypothetical protein
MVALNDGVEKERIEIWKASVRGVSAISMLLVAME